MFIYFLRLFLCALKVGRLRPILKLMPFLSGDMDSYWEYFLRKDERLFGELKILLICDLLDWGAYESFESDNSLVILKLSMF
jgi:hypothetical protein